MNFSPDNVLQDQQSLQPGKYLYMLNKISVLRGEKIPLLSKQNQTIFGGNMMVILNFLHVSQTKVCLIPME